jgi:glycosyltransferase involved in cell wall biosynthesis
MLASALAKSQNSVPLVVTLHCGFSKVGRLPHLFYNSFFGKIIFSNADRIIIVSPIELESIIELSKYNQKLRIIPNGVDLKEIAYYLGKEQTYYDHSPINLLFAGRLEKKKGLVFLLKAFRKIRHKNVELTIVGDGPFKQKLDDLIQKAKLQNKVHVMERLSRVELYDLYAKSHIFLLLSEFEAHSIALTEAIAFGLVPIVTNVGGNKFLVKNGTNGFLLNYPPDIEELSQILLRLVNNPKYMQSISENTKTQSRQFNIDVVVKKLCTIYQSITTDR